MMQVKTFFDNQTFTLTHVLYDEETGDGVLFDPVLDLDNVAWKTHDSGLKVIDDFIESKKIKLHYVIDTHVHADHLSGMQYIKNKYQVPLVINHAITIVQDTFKQLFNFDSNFKTDGSQFNILVKDGDVLDAGSFSLNVLHTPGHTPACTCYKVDDIVFTGDILFVPDVGTGRCDFPKGSAKDLYHSVMDKLYILSDETKVYPGHDYPGNRSLMTHTNIRDSKEHNCDLPASRSLADYIEFMEARDKRLPPPKLIYPSVQINMDAGLLPDKENNGTRYLKIPITD